VTTFLPHPGGPNIKALSGSNAETDIASEKRLDLFGHLSLLSIWDIIRRQNRRFENYSGIS